MWHGVSVAAGSTVAVIDLPLLKQRLSIDFSDDDVVLISLLAGATAAIDGPNGIGIAMMQQTWRKAMDAFPGSSGCILLPGAPVKSVATVTYMDANGVDQTMEAGDYRVDVSMEPARVEPAFGKSWPATRRGAGAVKVSYVLGETDQAKVPSSLVDAVCMIVSHRYHNREAAVVGRSVAALPLGVEWILNEHRRGHVAA